MCVGLQQFDQRRHHGNTRHQHASKADGEFMLEVAQPIFKVAPGGEIVLDQRSLFFGQHLGLPVWHAGFSELLDEAMGVEGDRAHEPHISRNSEIGNRLTRATNRGRVSTNYSNHSNSQSREKGVAEVGPLSVTWRSNRALKARVFHFRETGIYGRARRRAVRLAVPRSGRTNPVRPATRGWSLSGRVNLTTWSNRMTEFVSPEGKDEFALILEIEGEIIAARAVLMALTDLMGVSVDDYHRRARSVAALAFVAEAMIGKAEDAAQPLYDVYFARKRVGKQAGEAGR